MVLNEGIGVSDLYRIAAERNVQIRRLNHRHDSLEGHFPEGDGGSGTPWPCISATTNRTKAG